LGFAHELKLRFMNWPAAMNSIFHAPQGQFMRSNS